MSNEEKILAMLTKIIEILKQNKNEQCEKILRKQPDVTKHLKLALKAAGKTHKFKRDYFGRVKGLDFVNWRDS